jgi:acetyl/propionyl-CoA carboxylase alpha subunit
VQAQIRIAAGEAHWLRQEDIVSRGHAIEGRVYAEDPAQQFLPSAGRIVALREPHGPGVRVDSGIETGSDVPIHYDPLLAKLSVWGPDRGAARRRLIAALRDYAVLGVTTNVPFLLAVAEHVEFAAGRTHTHFIAEHLGGWRPSGTQAELAAIAAAVHGALTPARGAGRNGADAMASTPWQTLGGWRLGETER